MRILVLGAGIIGIVAAYELAIRGCEVEVVDREAAQTRETSAATAGLISPGHSFAWAAPSAPLELAKSLFRSDTSIRVRPRIDPELIGWGLRFLAQCTSTRAYENTRAKLRLAQRSQARFTEVLRKEKFAFAPSSGGVLYLYRDRAALERGMEHGRIMRDHGQHQRDVSREELQELEPALAASHVDFVGAIHDSGDASGNPVGFAEELRRRCEELGVVFRFGVTVDRIESDGARVTGVRVSGAPAGMEVLRADAYVLALGSASAPLSRTLGVRIPVYPARGYSITVPVRAGGLAPRLGGIDEKSLVAWSRFGHELRMSATAEFAGYATDARPRDFRNLLEAGAELFPDALDLDRADYKVGLRPMTPDGPPIIGTAREPNLFYDTGHGHLGWTMAFGSAELVADQIEGRPAVAEYAPTRWPRVARRAA
jgi:D-amino-acid dehydrogenase